jgi:proteasome lid subunit RPN8/RPN11
MIVRISSALLDGLIAEAGAQTTEICGLLLGREDVIAQIRPAANVAADPARQFEIDPAVLIGAHRAARAGGFDVLGHYHSHPSGVAEPSAADAAAAAPDGALWLVLAGGHAQLWQAGHEGVHGRFAACTLDVRP